MDKVAKTINGWQTVHFTSPPKSSSSNPERGATIAPWWLVGRACYRRLQASRRRAAQRHGSLLWALKAEDPAAKWYRSPRGETDAKPIGGKSPQPRLCCPPRKNDPINPRLSAGLPGEISFNCFQPVSALPHPPPSTKPADRPRAESRGNKSIAISWAAALSSPAVLQNEINTTSFGPGISAKVRTPRPAHPLPPNLRLELDQLKQRFDAMMFHGDDLVPDIDGKSGAQVLSEAQGAQEKAGRSCAAAEMVVPCLASGSPDDHRWRLHQQRPQEPRIRHPPLPPLHLHRQVPRHGLIVLWLAREGTYIRESKNGRRSFELLVEAMDKMLAHDKKIRIAPSSQSPTNRRNHAYVPHHRPRPSIAN